MNLTALILVLGFGALVALTLKIAGEDKRSQEEKRGWRLRCVVAGQWAYEEKKDGNWVGITLAEIGDYRESPHIIGVPEADDWRRFPSWAADRRDEIIERVKSELKRPHYVLKNA